MSTDDALQRDALQLDPGARRGRPVARILVVWLSTAVTLVLLSALLSGIQVDSWGAAVAAAAVIGLLNALLWPLIVRRRASVDGRHARPGRDRPQWRHRAARIGGGRWAEGQLAGGGDRGDDRDHARQHGGLERAGDRRRRLLVPARPASLWQARPRRLRTSRRPACCSSRSTASPTTSCSARFATGTRPRWRAGCGAARTVLRDGRPTGPPRPARARPASCTATTTTCPPSAGGRRTAARRSSRTIRATPRSSSAATPTVAGCCSATARAARTSSRAMRRTACSR